ncbi:MAG: hypothetical protein RIQ78_113 [Bacteroidota bacterium]|jgi:hypothetical protein
MRYCLLLPLFFLSFCRNKSDENQLVIAVEKTSLHAAPGIKSPLVAALQMGDRVIDLGDVSHYETELTFGTTVLRMPWIKVKTAKNQEGWVFVGAVTPRRNRAEWLLDKRLDCYFGHEFLARLTSWKDGLSGVQTELQFAGAYRRGIAIRDSMAYWLGRRSEPAGLPDYRWLAGVMPGFVYQDAFDGGLPNLFVDYPFWGQQAQRTRGRADDAFVEVCFAIFPQDSIESYFPVWKFQLSETASASQLGTGAHLKIMQLLDKNMPQSRIFESELLGFKEALLEDVHDPTNRYWQSAEHILKELESITTRPPKCLSVSEINALRVRRKMFEEPEKQGIVVNMRSGE